MQLYWKLPTFPLWEFETKDNNDKDISKNKIKEFRGQ